MSENLILTLAGVGVWLVMNVTAYVLLASAFFLGKIQKRYLELIAIIKGKAVEELDLDELLEEINAEEQKIDVFLGSAMLGKLLTIALTFAFIWLNSKSPSYHSGIGLIISSLTFYFLMIISQNIPMQFESATKKIKESLEEKTVLQVQSANNMEKWINSLPQISIDNLHTMGAIFILWAFARIVILVMPLFAA